MTISRITGAGGEPAVGRRVGARHAIDLAARLVTGALNVRLRFEDISPTGARLRLMQPCTLGSGRLSWLGYTLYGDIVWQRDLRCGFAFDTCLSDACLEQTLSFASMDRSDGPQRFQRLASAWVHGPGDW